MMKQMVRLKSVEVVLEHLGIKYREYPCRNGELYFCTVPNGLTFDLKYDEDGTIQLWRFVGTAPTPKAKMRCEYCKPGNPHSVIGIEITDEGDVSFYAMQTLDKNGSDINARIDKMISGYVKLAINSPFLGLSL